MDIESRRSRGGAAAAAASSKMSEDEADAKSVLDLLNPREVDFNYASGDDVEIKAILIRSLSFQDQWSLSFAIILAQSI